MQIRTRLAFGATVLCLPSGVGYVACSLRDRSRSVRQLPSSISDVGASVRRQCFPVFTPAKSDSRAGASSSKLRWWPAKEASELNVR